LVLYYTVTGNSEYAAKKIGEQTEDEVIKNRLEKIKVETDIEVGDQVEIVEGALDKMIGTVVAVDTDTQKIKVTVEMFGRENNVELEFGQVRKINK